MGREALGSRGRGLSPVVAAEGWGGREWRGRGDRKPRPFRLSQAWLRQGTRPVTHPSPRQEPGTLGPCVGPAGQLFAHLPGAPRRMRPVGGGNNTGVGRRGVSTRLGMPQKWRPTASVFPVTTRATKDGLLEQSLHAILLAPSPPAACHVASTGSACKPLPHPSSWLRTPWCFWN